MGFVQGSESWEATISDIVGCKELGDGGRSGVSSRRWEIVSRRCVTEVERAFEIQGLGVS